MSDPPSTVDLLQGVPSIPPRDVVDLPDPAQGMQPGDRLIVGVWVALALAVGRALLQCFVDVTAEGERGVLVLEHLVGHLLDATERAWWIVPPLAVLPRGRGAFTILLRAVVAFGLSAFLLAGLPDGEPRYTPGFRSTRAIQGWSVIALAALVIVAIDRYATSPRRGILQWSPATRFLVTACVLLLGGGSVATVVRMLELRRQHVDVEEIVSDLLNALPAANIAKQSAAVKVQVGSVIADKSDAGIGGNRPSLVLAPDATVEFALDVPPKTALTFSCAIDRSSLKPKVTAPQKVTFSVAVDGKELWSRALRPQEREGDRAWFDQVVALDEWAGKSVRLALSTRGEGPEVDKVRAGFGRPLVVRTEVRPRVPFGPERMNVVFVVVDSLRPDHLGCYGYKRPTSPNIDQIALESVFYENAWSPSSWAWPSVASLFTGQYPPTHGVDDIDRCFLSDSLLTLAEQLQAAGWTTLGASANPLISQSKNFQQGFEDWREFPLSGAGRLAEQFEDWVHRYKDYQFFAFLHLIDPHRPWNPPEQWAIRFASPDDAAAMRHAVNEVRMRTEGRATPIEEQARPALSAQALVDLYDAEINFADAQIGRIRKSLKDEGLLGQTLIVITSDCGEVLGADPPQPGASLAPEWLRAPLLVRDPRRAPERVAGVADLVSLPATILQLLGVKPMTGGPLNTPLPPWGTSTERCAFAHTARGLLAGATAPTTLIGLTSADWRLTLQVDGPFSELIDQRPPERRGGGLEHEMETLSRQLRQWYDLCRRDAVARPFDRMDFDTRQALEKIGLPQR